jgi:hypothetical protein
MASFYPKDELKSIILSDLSSEKVVKTLSVLEKDFKKVLIDREITQKSVADHFGWSSQYVAQLVKGMTKGPAAERNLKLIKKYLGME